MSNRLNILLCILYMVVLAGCGGSYLNRLDNGSTVAGNSEIPFVLQTILQYDESGGGVPFYSPLENGTSSNRGLLISSQPVHEEGLGRTERWLVNVNDAKRNFLVEFFYAPGLWISSRPGYFRVRYDNWVKQSDAQADDDELELDKRLKQQDVKQAFRQYAKKDFSFSKEFGVEFSKAFAYSRDGFWGTGISGLQNVARNWTISNCEKQRQFSENKCLLVNVDGKWTR